MSTDAFLITCEHGGNDVPEAYAALFHGQDAVLATHRGWDPGALTMAHALAKGLSTLPPIVATVTRLLVDLNRSTDRPDLFSEFSGVLDSPGREQVLEVHYKPYRLAVEQEVARLVASGQRVIHVSSHSFTPNLNGDERNCDVGLLYDPRRRAELEIANRWQAALKRVSLRELPTPLRIRRNYPYHGRTIGFPTRLRSRYSEQQYCGFELEMNQAIVSADPGQWAAERAVMVESLRAAMSFA
ncbi:N-formylglutamate amidohydrolase [soil metagenome]